MEAVQHVPVHNTVTHDLKADEQVQGILVRNNWALLVGVCRIPQEDLQLILEFIEEISRNAKSVQEIQEILSKELCGYYKRSVGVSVVKGNEKHDFLPLLKLAFKQYYYRIWFYESATPFALEPFPDKK